MKKRDVFFVCIFTAVFMICATVLAGDFLCKQVEKGVINIQQQAGECIAVSEWSEESDLSQNIGKVGLDELLDSKNMKRFI